MNRNVQQQLQGEKGVDIRLPSTALFGVSSTDRYSSLAQSSGQSSSPYTQVSISSKQNFMNGFFTRIALTEVRLPWTIPTISKRNSNMIIKYFPGGTGTGTNYTLVFEDGWYDPFSLAAELESLVKSVTSNASFDVAYLPDSHCFQAKTNNTDEFYFIPSPSQPISGEKNNRVSVFEMMNWIYDNNATTTLISGIPSMLSTKFVDIVSEQLTYNQDVKDADTGTITRDVLARIYLTPDHTSPQVGTSYTYNSGTYFYTYEWTGSQPFEVYRQFAFPKQIKWSPNQPVGNLVFNLYDDQGYPLTSDNKQPYLTPYGDNCMPDWNITLLVSEV
jgi:hypothetical protein